MKGLTSSVKSQAHLLRDLRAHQVGAHEVVESMFLDSLFLYCWERPSWTTTEMLREENAADGKPPDRIFNGYREDFQPDP